MAWRMWRTSRNVVSDNRCRKYEMTERWLVFARWFTDRRRSQPDFHLLRFWWQTRCGLWRRSSVCVSVCSHALIPRHSHTSVHSNGQFHLIRMTIRRSQFFWIQMSFVLFSVTFLRISHGNWLIIEDITNLRRPIFCANDKIRSF